MEHASVSPHSFIITKLEELQEQPDLMEFLIESFSIATQTEDYLVFDLRRPVKPEEYNR